MSDFTKSIKLVIDVVGDKASAGISGIRSSIDETDGAWNKMKAGASSAFDAIGVSAGAVALSAGAALTAFGVKSVKAFEDSALGAGKLRDALGLSADSASRWQEVVGDLGIGTDALATSMGRMLKTAGATPQVFADLGVQIARTSTGAVDANGTFLAVIDRLHNMTDPAERAAAAQKLLGKSWQDASELINLGAAGVSARLADVESAKIFTDSQIDQSRKFRDAMDNLHDRVEDLQIAIGEQLVPALTTAARDANALVGPILSASAAVGKFLNMPGVRQAKTVFEDIFVPWKTIPAMLHPVQAAWDGLMGAFSKGTRDDTISSWADKTNAKLKALGPVTDESRAKTEAWFASMQKSPELEAAVAAATAKATAEAKANADAMNAQAERAAQTRAAFNDSADALTAWADSVAQGVKETEAFQKATTSSDWGAAAVKGASTAMSDFSAQNNGLTNFLQASTEAFRGFSKEVKDNGFNLDVTTEKGAKQQDALETLGKTIDSELADAYIKAAGNGDTFQASAQNIADTLRTRLQKELHLSDDQINTVLQSLGLMPDQVTTRYQMSGTEEARLKIGLLQGAIDNLPLDVQAKVTQQVIAGDYQGALNTIQDYNNRNPTENRTNSVAGDVASGRNAVQNFNNNNPTTVLVRPVAVSGSRGVVLPYAAGGTVGPGGGIAGEDYLPEIINDKYVISSPTWEPPGTKVTGEAETARRLASGDTYNLTIVNNHRPTTAGDLGRLIQMARLAA